MCYNTKAVRDKASKYGLVAQLGERTVRIREVRGFDPLRVHQNKKQANGLFFCFAQRGSNPHRTRRGRVHRPVRTSGRFLYFFFPSPRKGKRNADGHPSSPPKQKVTIRWLFCFAQRGSNPHRTRRGRVHRPVRTSGRFLYFFFPSPAREKEMQATPLRVLRSGPARAQEICTAYFIIHHLFADWM